MLFALLDMGCLECSGGGPGLTLKGVFRSEEEGRDAAVALIEDQQLKMADWAERNRNGTAVNWQPPHPDVIKPTATDDGLYWDPSTDWQLHLIRIDG